MQLTCHREKPAISPALQEIARRKCAINPVCCADFARFHLLSGCGYFLLRPSQIIDLKITYARQ